jgi:hypothetical protein
MTSEGRLPAIKLMKADTRLEKAHFRNEKLWLTA